MKLKELPKLTEKQLIRFWSNVDLSTNGCWTWKGSVTGVHNRAVFYVNDTSFYASRLMYLISTRNPGELFVLHKCDNVICVNPNHLFLGTKQENNLDRDQKGRHVKLQGEDHGMSKLTEQDVSAIRLSRLTQNQLSEQYGVSKSTIWRALNTHWRCV